MSSILLPSTRISAPAGFVDVDHLNQFSSGLSGGFLLPRTSINGRAINSTLPVGVDDQYSCFISNSSSGVVTIPDCFSPQTSGVTIYILAKRYGAQPDSGFGTTFLLEKVSGVQVAFCHFIKDSGERVRFDTTSDDDSSNLWETSVDWPVGQWQVGAYVFSSGFEPKVYRNGVVQTLSSSAGAISGTLKPSVAGQVNLSGLRLNGAVAGVLVFSSAHSSNRIYDFSKNIWQIEKKHLNRIWFDMGAASGGAVASGSLQGLTLTSPTGTASSASNGTGTGVFAALSLTSPGGSAAGSAVATGSFAYLSLTAPGGSAAGSALATGSPILVSLSVPAGSASGTVSGDGVGTGSVSYISLSNPVGSASGTAVASGSLAALSLSAPSGSAFSGTVASGDISSITLSAPSGYVTVSATATGDIIGFTLSAPTGTASGASPTVARPISDSVVGGWLPSTGSALYPMVDEATPDDADYIYANTLTACKMALNAASGSGGKVVSYRVWSPSSNGVKVRLMCGASLVKEWTHVTLPTTATTYAQSLTAGEIAGITDYSTLSIEMESI